VRRLLSSRGVVAAGDVQTARAGAQLLEQGGNAVDAAIASALAAFVCELPLCSPFGGGVMLVDRPGEDTVAIDMFARTPGLGGGPQSLGSRDFEGVEVSFGAATQIFHAGRASAAMPLALRGLLEAHTRWGSMPLEAIAAPAIALGRDGYELGTGCAFAIGSLEPILSRSPECRALFSVGEHLGGREKTDLAHQGERLVNPDLASTIETVARRPECLRELETAFVSQFGPSRGGLVTERDALEAKVAFLPAISVRHRDWELRAMPGPSTGGVLVALGLRLLEGASRYKPLSSEQMLLHARVQELLLAVRDDDLDEKCRDPQAVRALLDPARIDDMRAVLDLGSPSSAPPPPDNPLGSTTHISVIDADGACVSLTLTNGESCGSVIEGTGIVVNNLLGEQDIHPRGFHRDPPGHALSTMMAPTILRRGNDIIVLGSGGSNRLRNAILQVLVGLVEHSLPLAHAVNAPRLHIEDGARASIAFEAEGLPADVAERLISAYPHSPRVFDVRNLYFGGVHVALRRDGSFGGAGDPRRGGAVEIAVSPTQR
jgi:gamma-glutamyltranspeptidase/glutathione hydrolase